MPKLLIIAAGAATLFVELALIRYIPGQIRVLGYFTNFVLLAAFLGFGLGIMVRRRWPRSRVPARLAPFALLAIVGLAQLGAELQVLPSPEHFLFIEHRNAGFRLPIHPFLAIAFAVLAAGLLPLGHLVGRSLEGDRPLLRYALNILGSLVGIGLFVLLSGSSAPPWLWLLVAALLCCIDLIEAPAAWRIAGLVAVALTVAIVARATRGTIWSPYQKLTIGPVRVLGDRRVIQEWELPRLTAKGLAAVTELPRGEGFTVRVNDDSYQTPIDLRPEHVHKVPGLRMMRRQYDLPFLLKPRFHGRVLVLGAGTGNDVAAALRAGAVRVDAVEIDPEILALGARHPEKPYADPRVHVHLADARSFLARTDARYDMIVFGLLDSHVLTSSKSTVRLDSFVFTRQSFALAREHLKEDGIMVVSHAVGTPWFFDRMRATIAAAFGRPPQIVTETVRHPLGVVYAAGPEVPPGRPLNPEASLLTDDWPFVYLKEHGIPTDYLIALLLVGLLSALAVYSVTRGGAGGGSVGAPELHFFALGGGFLLLETRSLTVLALHLGSTWGVNAAVFAGVLLMALLATGAAALRIRRRGNALWWPAHAALAAALGLNYGIDVDTLTALSRVPRIVLSVTLVSLPLFASGLIFGLSIDRLGRADRALASNLLGAMLGGVLEYGAMVAGFRYLLVLAALLYLVALLGDLRMRERREPAGGPGPERGRCVAEGGVGGHRHPQALQGRGASGRPLRGRQGSACGRACCRRRPEPRGRRGVPVPTRHQGAMRRGGAGPWPVEMPPAPGRPGGVYRPRFCTRQHGVSPGTSTIRAVPRPPVANRFSYRLARCRPSSRRAVASSRRCPTTTKGSLSGQPSRQREQPQAARPAIT